MWLDYIAHRLLWLEVPVPHYNLAVGGHADKARALLAILDIPDTCLMMCTCTCDVLQRHTRSAHLVGLAACTGLGDDRRRASRRALHGAAFITYPARLCIVHCPQLDPRIARRCVLG